MLTVQDLQNFEKEIADLFEQKQIRGPIHLRGGHEEFLINIFKKIQSQDYVFASWAAHLECLLKGIPYDKVKKRILDGHSMAMNFPEYNFYTSSIVGGICPIATGVAYAIKSKNSKQQVWCFIGDMTFFAGITQESIRYSQNHQLPITFIILDNEISVCTPTSEAWGIINTKKEVKKFTNCIYHQYKNPWPHSGLDKWITF